jgi:hypothetical protein
MIKAQQSWVKHRDTPKYKEGDQVWLEGKNLRLNQPTAKLAPRRHGPFKVIKVLSPVSYQLALPTQWSIHPVFHIDLLTPYRETITHGPNYQRPVPELVDGEEEYSVEKILDSRKFGRRRRLQYLVKWEGYPDSDNMWVDKDDVFADDKVREFKASNPAKETHIRSLASAKSPYPSALQHSHLLTQHAHRYMSSNGRSDLADEATAGAYADSASGNEDAIIDSIYDDIRRMATERTNPYSELRQPHSNHDPHPPTPLPTPSDNSPCRRSRSRITDNTEDVLTLQVPEAIVVGDVNSARVASGAAAGGEEEARPEEPPTTTSRLASASPVSPSDIGFCDQCHGPREYCHGHESPAPTPVPAPVTPSPSPHQPLAPAQWRTFASLVKRPCLWQTTLPTPSKSVVKIPLKYRLPTPKTDKLPKGWVYDVAEVKEEDHASPSLYTTPCRPLTRAMRTEALNHRADPYRQLRRGTKTTKGQVTSLSPF